MYHTFYSTALLFPRVTLALTTIPRPLSAIIEVYESRQEQNVPATPHPRKGSQTLNTTLATHSLRQ